MKIVLAPDKFAGTLTAAQAAHAMAEGWRRVRPEDELVAVPMADGGEGTLDVVAATVPDAVWNEMEVADAHGLVTSAAWLQLPDGTALVEAATACGRQHDPSEARNPMSATSYGVGQLIRAAAGSAAVTRVVVGLGGTATVDGGAGAATALGAKLRRSDGNNVKIGPRHLDQLERVEAAPPLTVPVVAAADVTNPLLGPNGAVNVFAPQKGASVEDVLVLDALLVGYADIVERDLPGGPWRNLPGAGAAGGLGFGLAAFTGAQIVPGADVIADIVRLDEALTGAAVVITGEGSLDGQSLAGKVPLAVAQRAPAGARVFAIAGRASDDDWTAFEAVCELGPEGLSRARELVAQRAAELAEAVSP